MAPSGSKVVHDCKALHLSAITFIEFSSNGGMLVSGDESGQVGIWRCGKGGKLAFLHEFKRKISVTHCCFFPQELASTETEG